MYAGEYVATIIAAAWHRDRNILPPLSFLMDCGAPPLPDGEEFEDFEIRDRKRCMAVLALQCAEAMYQHVMSVDGPEAEAEKGALDMLASIGLSKAYVEEAVGEKFFANTLEKNAPSVGKLL